MGTKTISIRDDIYNILKSLKRENESFSDVIGELAKKKKSNLRDYFGALKDSKALDEIEDDYMKIRSSARSRV
ncbi:MAG: antitoxin VapB family protein [Candidatus Methanoperedens sp.]|nr:antitoxin VapB family protein [Candidatus Methanoperedens nitroreducens]MDJ1422645.1 antitoxin VapB family protein [Candidatus Methanoperedens sp.]